MPQEGIFETFECIELTYTVDAEKILKTKLVLSPPPSGCAGGSGGGFRLSSKLHYWRRPPQLEHVMNDHTICIESGRLNYFKAFATDEGDFIIRFNDNQVTSAWLVPGTERN